MRVAGFIADRIAFSKPRDTGRMGSFSRFIIRLSTAATIISVAVMVVTLALANGFQQAVSQKIFSFLGHLRIQEKQPEKAIISEETVIIANDTLAQLIKQNPDVKTIYPFATKYAMVKSKEEIDGVLIKGLDTSYDFNQVKQFIKEGGPLHYNDSSYSREIMISAYTASRLKIKLNDPLFVYFIRSNGTIRPDKLTVVGIFKTGIEDYDKTFAIGDLRLIQQARRDMYNTDTWNKEIGGYEVILNNYKNIDKVVKEVYDLNSFPLTWNTVSVKDISPNIFDWLNLQDKNGQVLIGFMVIIAVINLVTCLLILVLERVRMIGILKSLGATDWTVQRIFLRHSLIIAARGIFFGALAALLLLWLQQSTGFLRLPEDAYFMDKAAVKITWWEVAAICGGTLLVCVLVMMIPSLLVRRIQPVKAIQFR